MGPTTIGPTLSGKVVHHDTIGTPGRCIFKYGYSGVTQRDEQVLPDPFKMK